MVSFEITVLDVNVLFIYEKIVLLTQYHYSRESDHCSNKYGHGQFYVRMP